mgnify:FL=1
MLGAMVRISKSARESLRLLSTREKRPMTAVLEEAIEAHRRRMFLDEVNAGFAALRRDPKAWTAVERERAEWDSTLQDGLDAGVAGTKGGRAPRAPRRKGKRE